MGKHKHSKVKVFLNILREREISANPKACDELIPIAREKNMGKNKHSKILWLLNISREAENCTIPKPRDE